MHMYIKMDIHSFMFVFIYTTIFTCKHMYTHACLAAQIDINTYLHTLDINTDIWMCVHSLICIHTY